MRAKIHGKELIIDYYQDDEVASKYIKQRYSSLFGKLRNELEIKAINSFLKGLNMPKYNAFVKLLIDNANPPAFNMAIVAFNDIPGIQPANPELAKFIKELSRLKYGKDKNSIEAEIIKRSKLLIN